MISTAISYLAECVGPMSVGTSLLLEISLVVLLTMVNVHGIKTAASIEVVLSILKVVPLVLIPIFAFNKINFDNFSVALPDGMSTGSAIFSATLIAFWSFVGLEGGTSPADDVENPKKNVPMAIVIGTSVVALICFVNTVSTFGLIPISELGSVSAPLARIMLTLFGGGYDKFLGLLTFIMCAGSLNAWVLFSGQIGKSAAIEGIFPATFGKLNSKGSPVNGLVISGLGTVVLLVLQKTVLKDGIGQFIDMSVIVYVFLYLITGVTFFRFISISKKKASVRQWFTSVCSLAFCLFLIVNSELGSFAVLALTIVTGIPVYFALKKKQGQGKA
jgi:APA family basic amino acid/polyamine antiporter